MLPELKTERLVLRQVAQGDAAAIIELGAKDFEVARWMTSFPWPYEEGVVEAFLNEVASTDPLKGQAVFAITLDGALIGEISIQLPGELAGDGFDYPTLGYFLGREFHGKGYASEAARAVLEWGFQTYDYDAIAARVFEDNAVSRGLLRKLGFKPIGKTQRFSKALHRKIDNVIVCLTRRDFDMQRAVA